MALHRRSRALIALLVALACTTLDAAATYAWLRLDLAREGNPLLAGLIEQVGASTALLVRYAVGCALIVALFSLVHRSRFARQAFVGTTMVLVALAGWHVQGAVAFAAT